MNPVDYKSTLHLPQTDFPMKGNLPQKEPEMVRQWKEKNIYQKMIEKTKNSPSFVFQDGPPYANGAIHIGHALNKTLKDITVKYRNMAGYHTPFIPGWDCHGLPIEHGIMKGLGPKAKETTDSEIRKLCRAEATKWSSAQSLQFQRLGILADWDQPYLTMDPAYEAEEVREFARSYEKGYVYLGTKPVYWNWVLQTALAEAEVEYHQHKSPSIYVKFPVKDPETLKLLNSAGKEAAFVIWTTTPWTLPANLGISLHPEFEYGVYDSDKGRLVLAQGLKEAFEKENELSLKLVHSFKGEIMDRKKARHPFLERDSLILLGDHVTMDAGTGVVHTAPGHGADDYKVGLKYGLDILSPVLPDGTFSKEVTEFAGQQIFKANPLIVEKLKSIGALLSFKEFEHSYPHCWRTKVPLIYRATPQWFLGLDLPNKALRPELLKAVEEIRFFPAWGKDRLKSMMEGRPDWCLSRQRIWGVPIPIFYCKKTGEPLADLKIMMKVADHIEKNGGIDSFYTAKAEDFIGDFKPSASHPHGLDFGSQGFRHGKDILDVWFDSGISHAAVQKKRSGMGVPADLYLEGSDQHRGWFNTSLISSMVTNEKPPYKALLTHGFVNDPQGMKMSKSKGNTVDPVQVSEKNGAEILRLWSTYEDYGQDLKVGPEILDRVTETYRRIRNTMRYLLGSVSDFEASKNSVSYDQMMELDQWALGRLANLIEKCDEGYRELSFYKVYHALNTFFTVDLSAQYLDIIKDRLYTWKTDGRPRRSAQTVLFIMTDTLVRLMAPVLSFLAEEVHGYVKDKKAESVFLLDFPKAPAQWKNAPLAQKFEQLLLVRTNVQKNLEELRSAKTIGSSLEAQVTLTEQGDLLKILRTYPDLREFLIVSEVEVKEGPSQVQASRALGEKCVRCWTYSVDTKKSSQFPDVCPKCVEALTP
jgi:isoleucyl-tRNA synthetase